MRRVGKGAYPAFEFGVFNATGEFLGGCGPNRIDSVNRTANLGYWTRSDLAGRSIATRAAAMAIHWTFANTEIHRIEIFMSTANAASRRVAEKLGAYPEGIRRGSLLLHGTFHDTYIYSILRGDGFTSRRFP